MQVLHARCAGLDVHKKTVVACILVTAEDGRVQRHLQTFSTMTFGLLALDDWLTTHDVSQVAMESTGIYWRPVCTILEANRSAMVVNAQHIKAITTDSPQWQHRRLASRRRGDRSDPCSVRPAIAGV
jgi:transposase